MTRPGVLLALIVVAACATPGRTERDLQANWIGKTIEAFADANITRASRGFMRSPDPIGGGKVRYVYDASEPLTLFGWYGPIHIDAECTIHFTVDETSHVIEQIAIVRSYPGTIANTYCASKVS